MSQAEVSWPQCLPGSPQRIAGQTAAEHTGIARKILKSFADHRLQ